MLELKWPLSQNNDSSASGSILTTSQQDGDQKDDYDYDYDYDSFDEVSTQCRSLPYGLEWGDRSLSKKAQLNL